MQDQVINFFHSCPITSIQLSVGVGLWVSDFLGLVPFRHILFHPRLAFSPYWEPYRVVTSCFVTGYSVWDVIQRSVGLVLWQGPLEKKISGKGDVYQQGRLIKKGKQRRKEGGQKTLTEWLVTDNVFLKTQWMAVGCLFFLEGFGRESVPFYSGKVRILPYSMFPGIEYTMRWLWALTSTQSNHMVFGSIPMKPIYLPLILGFFGGWHSVKLTLKGLFAALVTAHFMQFKRDDGESVVNWAIKLGQSWIEWFNSLKPVLMGEKSGHALLNQLTSAFLFSNDNTLSDTEGL